MNSNNIIKNETLFCAHNYAPLPVTIVKARDTWVWDDQGNKYLDMLAAYSAINHGHQHPRILKALTDQCRHVALTSRAVHAPGLGDLGKKLARITGLSKTLAMNTGAEAVETALKAARAWGYTQKKIPAEKAEIIVACNNFHGRTYGAMSASDRPSATKNFEPLLPGFVKIPYDDIDALARAITPNTCAVFLEPIQGEGGIIVPRKGYLRDVRKICDENNVLMMIDEIQAGMGRTGKWFCYQHEDILPDGVCLGKALGGGIYPVSAFVATEELMNVFTPGSHGSTFGGNPLACAIACTAIDILDNENLITNSAELGVVFHDELAKLAAQNPNTVQNIRGKGYGLWAGLQLNEDVISAREFSERLLGHGILTKDTHQNVIRLAPPLTITEKDLRDALSRLGNALEDVRKN